jgi:pimeloyl-ACP methyl ester carboxylesterase
MIGPQMPTVVYLPPATGLTSAHSDEMAILRASGFRVENWAPPRGDGSPRGLRSAAGECAYWQAVSRGLADATRQLSIEPASCCYVGFNLGGSMAAYFASSHLVRALVVSGSVPRLSSFWPHSNHPVAVRVRRGAEILDGSFEWATRELDLTSSLAKTSAPLLLQCGRHDDWLEAKQMDELERVREVSWYDDDHAMMNSATRDARIEFLRSLAFGSHR